MAILSRIMGFGRQPALVRYGVTTAIVVLALPIDLGLDAIRLPQLFVLYPLIAAASAMFGRGPGVYATALCIPAIYLELRIHEGFKPSHTCIIFSGRKMAETGWKCRTTSEGCAICC